MLPNGIIIEGKGLFEAEDRKKHLLVKEQMPHLEIRFVFSNPTTNLYKGSKPSYADWCLKYGYKFAKGYIPEEWLRDTNKYSLEGVLLK